jgi:hypothetical protein
VLPAEKHRAVGVTLVDVAGRRRLPRLHTHRPMRLIRWQKMSPATSGPNLFHESRWLNSAVPLDRVEPDHSTV